MTKNFLLLSIISAVYYTSASKQAQSSSGGEQVFTLGVLIVNPNINEAKIAELITEAQQQSPKYENASSRYITATPSLGPVRLLVNPIYATGRGLDKVLFKLFCSYESRGLPGMVWSSAIDDLEQTATSEQPLLLLAPSVRAQASAIYAYIKKYLPMRKVGILASSLAPGYYYFVKGLRELAGFDEEGLRFSNSDFDSQQHHMSSRFIQLVRMDNSTEEYIRKELIFLRDNSDTRVYVIYADMNITDKIMEEAHLLGMTTSEFTWLLGRVSYSDMVPPNYPPGLIATTYKTSMKYQLLALKAAIRIWSEAVRRLLTNSSFLGDLNTPTISCSRFSAAKWLHRETFYKLLKQRLGKVMVTPEEESGGLSGLNDITMMTLEMNRRWKRIGIWTENDGLTIDDGKWLRRFDHVQGMGGKSTMLRIVTLDEPPYIVYELPLANGFCAKTAVPCRLSHEYTHARMNIAGSLDYLNFDRRNITNVCCAGFVVDLLRKLSYDIGFQFELFEVQDGKWGTMDQVTGQWNGLVQALLNNSADMVATSLKINTDRATAIDFSVPFYQTGVTILVRVREGVVSSMAFLEPFSFETWLVVFLGCVNAIAICIFLFENFGKIFQLQSDKNDNDDNYKVQNPSSLFGSFWLVLSMLFNAAMKTDTPKSTAARFLANVWALFCVIFMSSFMANLAAFMITKEEYFDFRGLDDYRLKNPYTRNPPWRFGTIPYGATEQLIRSNYPEMFDYMRKYMRPDVDRGVAAVQSGELDAFIYDASVLTYKAGRDKNCQLKTVGKWYAPTGYGFGFPKFSKWLQSINKQLLDYQVSGYLQHLEDYWLSSSCKQHFEKEVHKSHELGIANVNSLFGLLSIALTLCGIFFACEHFFDKRCKGRRRHSAWRLITPSFGRTFSIRSAASAAFHQMREVHCHNPSCRVRQRFLQQQLLFRKDKIRLLEEKLSRDIPRRRNAATAAVFLEAAKTKLLQVPPSVKKSSLKRHASFVSINMSGAKATLLRPIALAKFTGSSDINVKPCVTCSNINACNADITIISASSSGLV